jgi:hypothetical protein
MTNQRSDPTTDWFRQAAKAASGKKSKQVVEVERKGATV